MDVQGLAVGVVIDPADSKIAEFEPDFVGWRDQAPGATDRCKMPDRQHGGRKRDGQQQRPQARPPCTRTRRLARCGRGVLGIGRERGHDQVGYYASTKLVSMKVAKSGRRLICFSASIWSA